MQPQNTRRPVDILKMDDQEAHIRRSLVSINRCTERLLREGFIVLGVHVENRNPRVVIQHSGRCNRLQGAMAIRTRDARGTREIMVAEVEGCQVQWTTKSEQH